MRRRIVIQSLLLVSALVGFAVSAHAQGLKTSNWDGAWRSSKDIKPKIELVVKDGAVAQLLVEGAVHEVADIEISPDQKTILFRCNHGQGTLQRVTDKAAEISLFGQSMKVRNMAIARN